MAAHAALNSVMNILQLIKDHPRPPITLEKQHMDSLCEIICVFQNFLENYSHRDIGDGKEALESQIANAAYAAEDAIESHIVNQILAKSNFHEKNNFLHHFSRSVKKKIRTLARFPKHKTDSNSLFCQDLQKVIEDMNLIKKEVMEIQKKVVGINDDQLPRSITSESPNIIGSSAVPPPKRKNTKTKNTNTVVGIDDAITEIKGWLTGHQTTRQILPIVGMGGIGKTTLARNVYDDPYIIKKQFDVRIWVTISQGYRLRDILLEALSCFQKDEINSSEDDLGVKLYKSLGGRRYLVVLDDMWSIEAWEELMSFFRDDNNGSRIVITTRLSDVSNHFVDHFESRAFKMDFLDEDKSWELLCKIVFEQDQCGCPPELEEIGKIIATNCKGLPLSISVIGGLLANSEKTQKHWVIIAVNLNPIVNLQADMHCSKILYLSYNHLPIHLKPCFLYMGVFPENASIPVSWLKRLWVSEGFLKPIAANSLEVVTEKYIEDLINRNLILVHELGFGGNVKYCKIHGLLRDLCLREGEKDEFLWVNKARDVDYLEEIQSQHRIKGIQRKRHIKEIQRQRRISVNKFDFDIDRVLEAVPSASLARSLNCDFKSVGMLSPSFRLMRVLNMGSEHTFALGEKRNRYSVEDVFKLVNSRYLCFVIEWKPNSIFPSSIHLLWNLQTLIIKGAGAVVIDVPPEIWEMSQLRHLEIDQCSLPDPPNVPLIHERVDDFILRHLHTLKSVKNLKLIEEVFKRIPNIKKLKVLYYNIDKEWRRNYSLNNLCLLNKLESLNIEWPLLDKFESLSIEWPSLRFEQRFKIELLQSLKSLHSLKKLSLDGCKLLGEDMRMIGSLPHLQVLKLKHNSFVEPEWNPVEGEFPCLKSLLIERCNDLQYWNGDSTHFPCLEQLALHFLYNLKEIPLDMGEIPTLRSIELLYCSNSLVRSAKNIKDKQAEDGNEDLQLQVTGNEKDLTGKIGSILSELKRARGNEFDDKDSTGELGAWISGLERARVC